ncbi:hypothetical protein VTO42DRAFT_494 [Malbranchea cinnamomea]
MHEITPERKKKTTLFQSCENQQGNLCLRRWVGPSFWMTPSSQDYLLSSLTQPDQFHHRRCREVVVIFPNASLNCKITKMLPSFRFARLVRSLDRQKYRRSPSRACQSKRLNIWILPVFFLEGKVPSNSERSWSTALLFVTHHRLTCRTPRSSHALGRQPESNNVVA